jgi:hypothetical protein
MAETTYRNQLLNRWGMLKQERASWFGHWQEISKNLLPRQGRFFIEDRNRGERRHNSIYDSTGTRALRVLSAGMMGGATSPARPWFRLEVQDKDLMKSQAVKVWLDDVTRLILQVFQKSNTYRALHSLYGEMGGFGTGASLITDDFKDVLRHFPLTTGEYCLAQDWRGEVCTIYREFQSTVGSLVKEFGLDKVSQTTRNMYDRGQLDSWVTTIHAIEPRADRDPSKLDRMNMPWRSCYFELGDTDGRYLRESGFKRFPAICPRWDLAGGDIYGNGPGMEALGDIKQLQHQNLRKGQAIDYQTKPPLQVPISMKNQPMDQLPGGVSYYDPATGAGKGGILPAWQVNLNLDHLRLDMAEVRQRIQQCFYSDLFLMLANIDHTGMTATEVAERHEEKLLMLGPVLERLDNEALNPLVDNAFDRLVSAGALPPPPPELHEQELQVIYTSVLAQAQRAVATNGVDRFVANLGTVAQFKPGVLDKFDEDQWADAYSDMLGVAPNLITPSDKVAIIRQQRAQQQQAAAQAEQMQQASETARNLGATPTNGGNAASDVLNLFAQGVGR